MPPSLSIPLLDRPSSLRPTDLPADRVEALYVHIPFCFHKCHYCDFYSITRQTPERMSRFVDLLLREADQWLAGPQAIIPETVFFGGGTPSLLPIDQMRRLVLALRDRFPGIGSREWTVECNPATVDADYCRMLRESGVDRLSFGAQSFDTAELALLERHHNPAEVFDSIRLARDAGFERLNVDLIYAVPSQSLDSWNRSLDQALSLHLSHLSCYGLTYETNTAITVRKRLGQFTAAEESLELQMLRHTRSRLTSLGLPPYEISNYATPGQECQHNLVYWSGRNYLGLGPSAASHLSGRRFRNRPHLGEWETAVAANQLPAIEFEHLTPAQRAGELVMLQLRLTEGVRFGDFNARTGLDARTHFADSLAELTRIGMIEIDQTGFRLTDQGLNVADAVAGKFLEPT